MILSAYHGRSVKIHWNAVLMGIKASPLFSLLKTGGILIYDWQGCLCSAQDASCSVLSDARQPASLRSS